MKLSAVSFILSTLIYQATAFPASGQITNFTKHAVLDPNGDFQLFWYYDTDTITFQYHARSKGWAGLGFSPNGAMTGADIALFWIDASGKGYVSDRHASQNGYPPEDKHQDYELLEATKNDTHIIVTFRRKRNTCDTEDWPLSDDTTRAIYAMNDIIPRDKNDFDKHTTRGSKSLHFFDDRPDSPDGVPPEPGAYPVDFRVSNVSVPDNKDTLYYCEFMPLPKLSSKKHIIKIEPLVQKENVDVVHHWLVYKCGTLNVSRFVGQGGDCFDGNDDLRQAFGQCQTMVLAVWAVGGQSVTYPEDIGMPLYNPDDDMYVMIEMHYDNSQFKKGKVDSSGMRIWLTDHVRKIDAGSATFGIDVNTLAQILPPAVPEMVNYGYCNAKCTEHFPEDGIKILGALLHTHLAGRKIRLHHYRNGTQLPDIFSDDYYDFNYQDNRRLKTPVTVLPGDELVVECIYNTLDRTTTTFAGVTTHDEMCLVFADYYPAINDGFICSSVPEELLYAFDGFDPKTGKIEKCGDMDLYNCIKNYQWSKNETDRIIEQQRSGEHTDICLRQNFNETAGPTIDVYKRYGYVNVTEPYIPQDPCKPGSSA